MQAALVAVGPVQAPTALKARFSRIPVCCCHATTWATSAAVISVSGGVAAGLPAIPVGQVKSSGSVAPGVHWYFELHSLSAISTSSMSWPK